MWANTTDHQIRSGLRKVNRLNAVLGDCLGVQAAVYSVIRIIDQKREKGILRVGINVLGLHPIIVDEHMVKPSDDEIDRATGLNCHFMRSQLVMVPIDWIRIVGRIQSIGVNW